MEVIRTISDLRRRLSTESETCCVPTMGNIHDGHLSLVKIGKERAPTVVTTIFVNRLQFSQSDDFAHYPRTFDDDCEKLAVAGNDIVFCPDEDQMYP
ncbi:MAG: pantoate--beta-alanine ligase, partial [Burkholderiales bacterium]|nr:pantoate--beta-alanine ligase [Burkholderiales bacterium]